MRWNNKFWLFVLVCTLFTTGIAATLAILFWRQLTFLEQQTLIGLFKAQFWYFFSTCVFLFAAFGFTLDWFFRFYILPLNQMIEETRVMKSVNAAHRLQIDGSREIKMLSELINCFADQYEAAKHDIDQTIENEKAKTEAEKNILATIMAELTQGVMICDTVGRILLYNHRAQRLLNRDRAQTLTETPEEEEKAIPDGFVGLRRSVYALIDKDLVRHALKEIQRKLETKKENVSSQFVMVNAQRRQLHVEVLPILDADQRFAGFVLIFSDITHELEDAIQLDRRLSEMAMALRSSIAAIRSAVDLLIQFPEMKAQEKEAFFTIISDETQSLSQNLGSKFSDTNQYTRSRWPLVPIIVIDFISTLKSESADIANIAVDADEWDARCMIKVDNYSMVLAIHFVISCLMEECNAALERIRLSAPGNLVQMDLIWRGQPVKIETLRRWNERPLAIYRSGYTLTLKEVLTHHHAELWPHTENADGEENCLRLFIPMIQSKTHAEDVRKVTFLPKGRPEFYDFDLFSQAGRTPELENRLLGELTYTVFDTETTGLDPRGGDEIISIGAIRLVNGRLLYTESISQLVDPGRPIPAESFKYHGIDDEMLKGKPSIDQALAFFHRFAKNTVLVGHNAAFDMRMLQMKEKETNIRFINPVLDTMHLSAIVHPSHSDHSLDSISIRLGVDVVKRHDALEDAIATGKVFLKMIPLLNEKKIFTLKDALVASQRTYYARLKY